jgi:hypothetical protein
MFYLFVMKILIIVLFTAVAMSSDRLMRAMRGNGRQKISLFRGATIGTWEFG